MKSAKKTSSAKVETARTKIVPVAAPKAKKAAVKEAKGAAVKATLKAGAKPVSAAKGSLNVKATTGKAKAATATKSAKPAKPSKPAKGAKKSKAVLAGGEEGTAKLLDSEVAYEGPLFRVVRDHLIEPGGQESVRDVIRHNGSVVILAVDPAKKNSGKLKPKKDPWVVIERQYRHAAGQFLWELPAGKLDAGESPLEGAKRELSEETGYAAEKWSPLVEYFASPGFLGESMKVFLAEGLIAGEAHPEEDEKIDFRLVKLSELLEMADEGKIIDGKTLTTALLYARRLGLKRKK
jgi:ADP-ribose pyrophosphatase